MLLSSFVKYTFQVISGISEHMYIGEQSDHVYSGLSVTKDSC